MLENIRLKKFVETPSRLSSNFACENLQEAEFYRQLHSPTSVIYEVVVIDKHAKFHLGYYNMLPIAVNQPPSSHEQDANNYWEGKPKILPGCEIYECKELVIESHFKIISKLS